jgi:hypothetical protein
VARLDRSNRGAGVSCEALAVRIAPKLVDAVVGEEKRDGGVHRGLRDPTARDRLSS